MNRFFALIVAGVLLLSAAQNSSTPDKSIEAARLNSLGAAYMNQQLFEKGLKNFQDAAALDPKLEIAKLNQGIAQLNLTRIDPARQLLEEAVKQRPEDPNAWFNLGLLYKNTDNPQGAVDAFVRVTRIDPEDADTWYFLGASYSQSKQYPQAIDAFRHALKLNPLHASAEFGISRAYQQSGEVATAREHLQKFQHITQAKLGTPIGLAYGDQGKYSLVEESAGALIKPPAQIPVKFVDVTAKAGLSTTLAQGSANDLASGLGPGACFLDYDADGKFDIFLPDSGAQEGLALYHNLGSSKFEDVTKKAGLDTALHAIGCTVGDYDNDGYTDLAVSLTERILLLHNQKNGTFSDVTDAAGIKVMGHQGALASLGLTFIDYDHDGDLDLLASQFPDTAIRHGRPPPPRADSAPTPLFSSFVFRNNGNSTFTEVAASLGLQGKNEFAGSTGSVGTDYNNDRAVDIVASDHKPLIYENPREGEFIGRELWASEIPAPVLGTAVLDFNHDGWMDLAFTHVGAPGLTLWRNNHAKTFERVPLPATNWVRAFGIAAFDYDNDGWVDLVAAGETKDGKGEVRLFRNLGQDGFQDVTGNVGLDKITFNNPRAIATADYDGDGATDLLITQNHGRAILIRNEGGNKNNFVRLNFKGLADNKTAIGTKVEVFAGGNRQKFEIYGSNGYLGQNSTEIIAGLGQNKQADIVRMLWPSGVLQDEIEIAAGKSQSFLEMDRRGSSCPTLFAWDGAHYALVGDMLGAGVVGHWVGPGQKNISRPIEYIKLVRDTLKLRNGKLSFRFMEPLEEAVYLDRVNLLAIDHRASLEVFPNEYFASNPPYPPFKVVFARDPRPPAGAWDEHGHNVLPDLLAHRFFGDFELTSFSGFAKPHTLELDLGEPYRGGPLWLLMHGEIEYFTATGMYAADQAGIHAIAPYVEAQTSDGRWKPVTDDMGFPAGGPRTMTADLSGRLPSGTRRIRIITNLQVYWDNILISRTKQNQSARPMPIALARAELRFHGFPLKIEGTPPGNVQYVYEQASATGPYTRPMGAYTRYGDVRSLLAATDDRLAVFGSGDEVELEFDPSNLPNLPRGWVRDYFFAAEGYEKDMDFYAADGGTVMPLPFRSMGTYPYKQRAFPLDDAHLKYLLDFNTRHLSGNEARGYSFDYHETK
jgi:tetratricopeptide (TPR) repeat protein